MPSLRIQALLRRKIEQDDDAVSYSFERILLKFEKMQEILKVVRQLYREFANKESGKLNSNGLYKCMTTLHGEEVQYVLYCFHH